MNAQDFRSLQEAYLDVYIDEALTGSRLDRAKEIMKELPPNSPRAGALRRVANSQEGSNRGDTVRGDLPRDRSNTTLPTRRGGRGPKGKGKTVNSAPYGAPLGASTYQSDSGRGNRASRRSGNSVKEQYNIYDIILSHLLDEGYADTNENAIAIMVNMSEEWRESIVDEVLDEELTGERLARADAKRQSLGRKKSTRDARVALDRVARGLEGTGTDGGRKAPTKRGGGGTKGHTKTAGTAGYDSDRGDGNRAAKRAGTYRPPMW